ncbi:MAG: hypothetical protein MJ237_04095 [bacterium]|nr:hypothetical protein [bacterium]
MKYYFSNFNTFVRPLYQECSSNYFDETQYITPTFNSEGFHDYINTFSSKITQRRNSILGNSCLQTSTPSNISTFSTGLFSSNEDYFKFSPKSNDFSLLNFSFKSTPLRNLFEYNNPILSSYNSTNVKTRTTQTASNNTNLSVNKSQKSTSNGGKYLTASETVPIGIQNELTINGLKYDKENGSKLYNYAKSHSKKNSTGFCYRAVKIALQNTYSDIGKLNGGYAYMASDELTTNKNAKKHFFKLNEDIAKDYAYEDFPEGTIFVYRQGNKYHKKKYKGVVAGHIDINGVSDYCKSKNTSQIPRSKNDWENIDVYIPVCAADNDSMFSNQSVYA